MDSTIRKIMQSAGTPGIQIAYSKGNDKVLYATGLIRYGAPEPIRQDTRFQAASLTKVITAYAFFKLLDKGIISLDTPLMNYYPYDRLRSTVGAENISARMILTHHSGLLNWEGAVPPTEQWRATPLTLQFTPDTDYLYSGEGFYFLQETLEHITGKSYQQIIDEEVLIPLAMHHSTLVWHDSLTHQTAYGHYEYNKPRYVS